MSGGATNAAASPGAPLSPGANASVHVVMTAIAGFSSPVHRGQLNHGAVAELQEGFRILTGGQNHNVVETKDLHAFMRRNGVHVSEEELTDALQVVHQTPGGGEMEFAEFLLLMTREVPMSMVEEMKSAFRYCDKAATGYVSRSQFTELFAAFGEQSSAEELEELMALAENHTKPDDSEMIDYGSFVEDLTVRVNKM